MKQTINKYIVLLLVVCAALVWGCQKVELQDEPRPEGNVLRISTRAANNGDDAENAIRTLRLFIFDKDGKMVVNKLFMASDAKGSAEAGGYTYFVKDDNGNFLISELIQKMDIEVMMVANEMTPFDDLNYSKDAVVGEVLNFRDMYNGGNAFTDIQITGVDNNVDNKGFIPMFAQTGLIARGDWDVAMGKVINLRMVRNLAKTSISIKAVTINDPSFVAGDQLTIKSASIGRMPAQSFLGYVISTTRVPFTFGRTVDFKTPITIKYGESIEQTTDKLTFYLPEYNISQPLVTSSQYAFLQVNAVIRHGDGEEHLTSYRIPIGNGVSKLYGMNIVRPEDLAPADLTVTRNNYYNFEATIKTIGSLEALQVDAVVKDWESTIEIEGDDRAPLLNVSTLLTKMTENKVRVHFWTNEQNVGIEEYGTIGGVRGKVNDVFTNLSAALGTSTSNFVIFPSSSPQYYRFNGYIDFQFNDPAVYTAAPQTYSVVLRAGKLTRTLSIESNPVVGQVVFDANGGKFPGSANLLTTDLRVQDVGLDQKLVGSTITINDPKANLTPPAGKTFVSWVYHLNGASAPNPVVGGKLDVTMSQYVTTLYAVWR